VCNGKAWCKRTSNLGAIRFSLCVSLISSLLPLLELNSVSVANNESEQRVIKSGIRNNRKSLSGRCVAFFGFQCCGWQNKDETRRDETRLERNHISESHSLQTFDVVLRFCWASTRSSYLSPNIGLILVSFEKDMTQDEMALHTMLWSVHCITTL